MRVYWPVTYQWIYANHISSAVKNECLLSRYLAVDLHVKYVHQSIKENIWVNVSSNLTLVSVFSSVYSQYIFESVQLFFNILVLFSWISCFKCLQSYLGGLKTSSLTFPSLYMSARIHTILISSTKWVGYSRGLLCCTGASIYIWKPRPSFILAVSATSFETRQLFQAVPRLTRLDTVSSLRRLKFVAGGTMWDPFWRKWSLGQAFLEVSSVLPRWSQFHCCSMLI
jgi:hypothetical protein